MLKKIIITTAVSAALVSPVAIVSAPSAQAASESPTCVKMNNYFHTKLWGPYMSATAKAKSASSSAQNAYASYKYYAGEAAKGNSVSLNKKRANQWKASYNKYNATARSQSAKARALKAQSNRYLQTLNKKGCHPFVYGE